MGSTEISIAHRLKNAYALALDLEVRGAVAMTPAEMLALAEQCQRNARNLQGAGDLLRRLAKAKEKEAAGAGPALQTNNTTGRG